MPPAPALHDVASKPLAQLMRELAELVKRARAGSLRSSEVRDPPITVIHLGEQSVQSVFGVIHPPKVALVGLGGIDVRPWVEGGQVRALPLLCATLAADGHRGDALTRHRPGGGARHTGTRAPAAPAGRSGFNGLAQFSGEPARALRRDHYEIRLCRSGDTRQRGGLPSDPG